ncbi:MAG TPA: DoxX family protein, partial [Polyangiaceae bacterium]|nr:DoxX family protein [Polyangiaceae bacterium]
RAKRRLMVTRGTRSFAAAPDSDFSSTLRTKARSSAVSSGSCIRILAPRFPRLKEWAYAGMFFDLTGAALSHAAAGDPASNVVVPLVILALAASSWALRTPSSGRVASREPLSVAAR